MRTHLEQILGPDDAATLMEHLTPSEWNELATKADFRDLREELRAMEGRLKEHTDLRVRAVVGDSTRALFFSMLASHATFVGLVPAAVKLG